MRLRVIAGSLGGRMFEGPDSHATHPMSERVRGALFNSLGDLDGKTVLDPFAGSGAFGFEAVSRGAKSVTLVERDRKAQVVIAENIAKLGVSGRISFVRANCRAWAETYAGEPFDLILCDPPYDDVKVSTLELLQKHLKHNGLMVLSHSGRESAPTVNGVVVVDKRIYGDAALAIYRHEAAK